MRNIARPFAMLLAVVLLMGGLATAEVATAEPADAGCFTTSYGTHCQETVSVTNVCSHSAPTFAVSQILQRIGRLAKVTAAAVAWIAKPFQLQQCFRVSTRSCFTSSRWTPCWSF